MRRWAAWTGIAGATLALAGCGEKKGEAGKPAATTEATSPAAAAPAPSASASAAAPSSGLALVASGSGMRLYGLGSLAALVSGRLLFVIDDAGLHQDPVWQAGFSGIPDVPDHAKNGYDVMGVAPDTLWLQAWVQGNATMDPFQDLQTFRWTGKIWGGVRPLDQGETVAGVVPIGKGRTAALVLGGQGQLRWIPGNTRSAAVPSAPTLRDEADDAGAPAAPGSASASAAAPASASAAPTPSASASAPASASASAAPPASASAAPPASASAAPPAKPEPRPARVHVSCAWPGYMEDDDRGLYFPTLQVSGSAAGQVVLAGNDRGKGHAVIAERWAPGASKSVVEPLPEPAEDEDGLYGAIAVGEDEAWVYATAARPYLVHRTASGWAREAPPVPGRIASMAAGDDGSVVLVVADNVFRRAPGDKAWKNVPVPAHTSTLLAAAVVAGKLWVASSAELFGPVAPKTPVHLPGSTETAAAREDLVRYPLTDVCASPYVVLRSRVSPAAKSFPDVETLVKATLPLDGVELLTEISAKWTYLGARVPTVAAAEKLRNAMNDHDPGAGATAWCHVPRAVKRIQLSP
jgi:hypothetical protein